MELWLSVRDPAQERATDVLVEADAGTAVADLAETLGGVLGRPANGDGPDPLYLGGLAVDPGLLLEQSPLRDGVQLGLAGPVAGAYGEGQGIVEVRVVGGLDAGGVRRLGPGSATAGSAEGDLIRVDDPALPAAALRVDVAPDGAVTVRPGAVTDATIEGAPLAGATPWPPGHLLAVGRSLLEVAHPDFPDAPLRPSPDGAGFDYNRPPRLAPAARKLTFPLPKRPEPRKPGALPWVMAVVPLIFALVMVRVTGNTMFLAFALMSPVIVVSNHMVERRRGTKTAASELEDYEKERATVIADATAAIAAEMATLRTASPDPAVVGLTATGPRRRLWERRRTDADFGRLRVGTGSVPTEVTVTDPDVADYKREPLQLTDVPVTVSLVEDGVVGVAGEPGAATALGRWLLAQAAVLHSPADLEICVLVEPGSAAAEAWAFARWLPHARPPEGQAVALLGTDVNTVGSRIGELQAQLTARKAAIRQAGASGRLEAPAIVVVLDGSRKMRSWPGVAQILGEGPSVGIYAICLDTDERLLPEECKAVAVVDHHGGARVRRAGRDAFADVRPDGVGHAWCEHLARSLAPIRDAGRDDDSSLPDSSRLLDVLGLEPPDAERIAAAWLAGGRDTRAVLGESLDGPFSLDVARDGPHGLVAGTTGSGKSELLQTFVASLAVANRPDQMTFVLVDYKGGSAFAECALLPHTVGMVTDLGPHLVARALESLGAELRRREHLVAAAGPGINGIGAYQEACQRNPALPPMPRLMIIIDEFASLARELPDFITGLVNVAQRGRSLGIHMILATQRPAGVVSAEIRANTNLRIALRMTDASESSDVIDAPDAARIPKSLPGRAYVRLGHNVLLPFQAGRVGGRRAGEKASRPPFVVPLTTGQVGQPAPVRPKAQRAVTEAMVTDLGVLVEAIRAAAERIGVPPQPSPWLDPLPDLVALDDLPAAVGETRDLTPAVAGAPRPAPYALVDLPKEQRRVLAAVDLATFGHLYVAGASRSGRSQALRTIAGSLAREVSSADVHLYGIECGNGALLALTGLPHCGAVVRSTDPERIERLLGKLAAEVRRRSDLLGESRFGDITEQRAAAARPEDRLPHIVLFVNRWEGYLGALGDRDSGALVEAVLSLLRSGPGVGVHVVISGDQTVLGGRLAALTENKLVLRLADPADFGLIGIPAKSVPAEMPPGRAYEAGAGLSVQLALLDPDPSGAAQAAALERIAVAAATRDAAVPAALRPFGVDVLPARIGWDAAWALRPGAGAGAEGAAPARGPLWGMVAIGGDRLTALGPDLATGTPAFIVAGPPESGRSTALAALAASYLAVGTQVVIATPRASRLRELAGAPGVRAAFTGTDLGEAELTEALVPEGPVVVLVDDAELLRDCGAAPVLGAIVRRSVREDVALVLAGDADAVCSGFSGWQVDSKRARRGLLLSPQNITDAELIGTRIPRALIGAPVEPGRGLLHLGGGDVVSVQVPLV